MLSTPPTLTSKTVQNTSPLAAAEHRLSAHLEFVYTGGGVYARCIRSGAGRQDAVYGHVDLPNWQASKMKMPPDLRSWSPLIGGVLSGKSIIKLCNRLA